MSSRELTRRDARPVASTLMTALDIAGELRCSEHVVHQRSEQGTIPPPATRINGRDLWNRAVFMAWLQAELERAAMRGKP